MRPARALRAIVSQAEKYLEAGSPTGLTGLLTHQAPRPELIRIYTSTLERLKLFPESSVYRQSAEALTKHRLAVVEQAKPVGLADWQGRVREVIERHPHAFRIVPTLKDAKEVNFVPQDVPQMETNDAFPDLDSATGSIEDTQKFARALQMETSLRDEINSIEAEPRLSVEQITEVENQIGAGLLEEIIQVAEGERQLVDTMLENKVWEELEEKPQEGQWAYSERGQHTPTTQAPDTKGP